MGYTLEQADSQEFARWWVVYRGINEDFSQNFHEQIQDIVDVPFCHWIVSDGQRVGGCVRVGHNIGDLFLIPPYHDLYIVLKDILPADGTLVAQGILSDHVAAFQMSGFQLMESRVWMLRPTQAYDNITFRYSRSSPQPQQADAIAQLMLDAFKGGVGQYGMRDLDAHRNSVNSYFESITSGETAHIASSVLMDGDKLMAACLIQTYKSLMTIRFVVVHPDYQNQGIAHRLMSYGIHTLHPQYDHVTLAVTIGNPAHGLYHRMGFASGATTHTLKRT